MIVAEKKNSEYPSIFENVLNVKLYPVFIIFPNSI